MNEPTTMVEALERMSRLGHDMGTRSALNAVLRWAVKHQARIPQHAIDELIELIGGYVDYD